ncbi:MAG: signal peptidase I [Candidatus Paceibacterota bacterium]|jgi:signal peptidase
MKFIKTIYYIFIVCIVAVAILLLVSIFPITGNYKILVVQSGSMEPSIHTGSVVVVKPISDYKVGDIITFGPNTKTQIPTTHRITEVRVQEGQMVYRTRGDANNGEDLKEVSMSEIIGKVYFSVPYVGYIIDFVKKPIGLILVVVLPAIFIIYDEVRKIIKEARKIKKRNASSINNDE